MQCINDEIAFVIEEDGTISKSDKDDGYTVTEKKDMEIVAPDKTDTDLAVEVWYGVYGSKEARRKALGGRFETVQKEVGEIGNSLPNFITASKAYMKKHGCKKLI